MPTGLVHIYTGNGKGKSTAACGLAVRAAGHGMRVLYVQFLKQGTSGEIKCIEKLEDVRVLCTQGIKKFVWNMNEEEKSAAKSACEALFIEAARLSEQYDMMVMDEIMGAISTGLLEKETVIGFVQKKPAALELILTGRTPPPELMQLADYVSEIQEIRHPFQRGIPARKGIEY